MTNTASGPTRITGTVIAGGVVCPLLRLDDGRVFALQSIGRADAPVGARLEVEGQPIAMSTCQQGDAFLVTAVISKGEGS